MVNVLLIEEKYIQLIAILAWRIYLVISGGVAKGLSTSWESNSQKVPRGGGGLCIP